MSACKICEMPLTVELEADDFDEATSSSVGQTQSTVAPDDLLVQCGCHFHWQCLLDESSQIALDLACPVCQRSIVSTAPGASSGSPNPIIRSRYHNEGGVQENLDIFPLIQEEAYLEQNPSTRPARAMMTILAEGDVEGVVELLKALEEDPDEGDMSPAEILRFEDPLDGRKNGLIVAIEKGQQEATWLLLWLASRLPMKAFPDEVVDTANAMGAGRESASGVDIRGLKDEQGRTAEDVARSMGGVWLGLVNAGYLKA